MHIFVDEYSLSVVIDSVEQKITELTADAIALGTGQIAIAHPEMFDISLDDPMDDELSYIDIKDHGDGRIAAIGLDGFGLGDSIPEAVGWLLFISDVFDQLPRSIELALEETD